MSLSPTDIKAVLGTLQDSEWDQAVIVIGDVEIAVSRNGAALASPATAPTVAAVASPPAPAPTSVPVVESSVPVAAAPAVAEAAAEGHVVAAPSVGVFWRASQPGAAPFVEVGSRVEVGDTLGIVEVMKLMNNIAADVAGEVVAIHVANAAAVEFGTPLVTIRTDA